MRRDGHGEVALGVNTAAMVGLALNACRIGAKDRRAQGTNTDTGLIITAPNYGCRNRQNK